MIQILYNTFSENGKGFKKVKLIEKILESKKMKFESHQNIWPENFIAADEIWIVGGDGTMNYILNKYGPLPNTIALFAGGTGNDFHNCIYGNISIEEQIEKVLQKNTWNVDIAKCNDDYFINMLGLGFDGEVLKSIHKYKWLGGHLAYLLAVIVKIFKFKEISYSIQYDDETATQNLLLLLVTNAGRTGGGFKVSPKASITDGKLNFISCLPLSLFQRFILLPKVEKGKHLNDPNIFHTEVTKCVINTTTPTYYQLDGELKCASRWEVEVICGGVRMLV